jgi:hypothetical protein
VHLTLCPSGSFRTGNVDGADCHFAFRTDDFDGALATLTANGFREDAAEDDPMRVMVRRKGPVGFPQLFLLDPRPSSRSTARRSHARFTRFERVARRESTLRPLSQVVGRVDKKPFCRTLRLMLSFLASAHQR